MPLQNRVSPDGDIVARPERGLFMGNRGRLHDADRRIRRTWNGRLWIVCVTDWRGRRRAVMAPGRYTELFFLDEAVALAAGHRPCAQCRNGDYRRFKALWIATHPGPAPSAAQIDRVLHDARVDPATRTARRHRAPIDRVPEGAFVRLVDGGAPHLVREDHLLPFSFAGYGPPAPRPRSGDVAVLTPAPTVAVLAAGYRPALHPSAG